MLIAVLIPIIALLVFFLYCYWRIYEKMGEKGWYSIIPFYSNYVLYRHTWGQTWYIPFFGPFVLSLLLGFIPSSILSSNSADLIESLVTIGLSFVTNINLYAAFGHGIGFSILGTFLPFITIPICALGDDDYVGCRR